MPDKLMKSNSTDSIRLLEKKIYLQRKALYQLLEPINQFAFINGAQWTLLMTLNIICLIFILFASMLVA